MSSNKRSADGEGEDDPDKKKQKSDESTASAAAANPPPPAAINNSLKLDNNMIGLVFGFLELDELKSVVRVSKRWWHHLNAPGMPLLQISLTHPLPHLGRPLKRHVTTINAAPLKIYPLILEQFQSLTNLHLILDDAQYDHRRLDDGNWQITRLPPLLKTLRVQERTLQVSEFQPRTNHLLYLIGQHPRVTSLDLCLVHPPIRYVNFFQLTPLSHFTLEFPENDQNHPLDCQVRHLRELPHLEILPCNFGHHEQLALRLLKPPHQLKYKSLGDDRLSIDAGEYSPQWHEAIRNLPTLTKFKVEFDRSAEVHSVTNPLLCLQLLIELEHLELWDMHGHSSAETDGINATELFNTLRQMHKLKCLQLHGCKLTSQHMAELLPQLPNLTDLKLFRCRNINSLNFLVAPINTQPFCSLTHLHIEECPIPDDPHHLHGLKNLRQLTLHFPFTHFLYIPEWMFLAPATLGTVLAPMRFCKKCTYPSTRLPKLTELDVFIGPADSPVFIKFGSRPEL